MAIDPHELARVLTNEAWRIRQLAFAKINSARINAHMSRVASRLKGVPLKPEDAQLVEAMAKGQTRIAELTGGENPAEPGAVCQRFDRSLQIIHNDQVYDLQFMQAYSLGPGYEFGWVHSDKTTDDFLIKYRAAGAVLEEVFLKELHPDFSETFIQTNSIRFRMLRQLLNEVPHALRRHAQDPDSSDEVDPATFLDQEARRIIVTAQAKQNRESTNAQLAEIAAALVYEHTDSKDDELLQAMANGDAILMELDSQSNDAAARPGEWCFDHEMKIVHQHQAFRLKVRQTVHILTGGQQITLTLADKETEEFGRKHPGAFTALKKIFLQENQQSFFERESLLGPARLQKLANLIQWDPHAQNNTRPEPGLSF